MVMKDLSRIQHRRKLRYAGLRLAQARPLLDSDQNTQLSFLEEERQRTIADLVGPKASPDRGFVLGVPFVCTGAQTATRRVYTQQTDELRKNERIATEAVYFNGAASPTSVRSVTLRAGTLLLGGQPLVLEQAEHIAFQRDYLQLRPEELPNATSSGRTLYALESWEQQVTSREDEELAEPMLRSDVGAVRIRRMRRVRAFTEVPNTVRSCRDLFDYLAQNSPSGELHSKTAELTSRARLRVRFTSGAPQGHCAPEGAENLTLRVMLTEARHLVWSLEKPQLFRVAVTGLDTEDGPIRVEMLDRPQNEAELPLRNRVAELLPFGAILSRGELPTQENHVFSRKIAAALGAFTRVTESYDPQTREFTVDRQQASSHGTRFGTALAAFVHRWDPDHPEAKQLNFVPEEVSGTSPKRYFYLRLWHDALTSGEVELGTLNSIAIPELGIELSVTEGVAGDYWYISLRNSAPGVLGHEFLTSPDGVAPHGPKRFLAPLALVDETQGSAGHIVDCMPRLERATSDSCVTFTVGDGLTSFGDYSSIQAAVLALPSDGGKITVLPGHYGDEVHIVKRRNIVIEGCGDATLLQSRRGTTSVAQFDIISSESISVSGLRFNSVEQQAIRIRDSMEVKLAQLSIESGTLDDEGVFVQGAFSTTVSVLDAVRSAVLDLRAIRITSAERPGLRFFNCELVTLDDSQIAGLTVSAKTQTQVRSPATQPLLTISGCTLVKCRKTRIDAYGQVGIAIRSGTTDVELSHLRLHADRHQAYPAFASIDTKPHTLSESRSCIDVEGGARITLERSTLCMSNTPSDHAAIVLLGTDLALRHNRVESLSPYGAWGGIQIRGGSERVELRYNRIVGGVGHGVTLGSVVWRRIGSPHPGRGYSTGHGQQGTRREGAGQAQMRLLSAKSNARGLAVDMDLGSGFEDDGGVTYLPEPEGAIFDLVIADNRIEAMNTSGISVLTVMGLRKHGGELFEIERARIENNVITNNLQRLGRHLPTIVSEVLPFPAALAGTGLRMPVLPFGGIVLSSANVVDIRNNTITNNGQSEQYLPICGLFILTGDALSISGNRITHNGAVATREQAPGMRAGIAVMLAGTGRIDELERLSPVIEGRVLLDAEGTSLRILNNNVVQPSGRALHAVATGPVAISGNFLSTESAQGSSSPEDLYAVGDVVFLQNLGMPWESFDISPMLVDAPHNQRSPQWLGTADLTDEQLEMLSPEGYLEEPLPGTEQFFNQYTTPPMLAPYLRNSSPSNPHLFMGEGGRMSFSDNQVVFCWTDPKAPSSSRISAPLCYVPVAIIGQDHVAVTGNQFGMRLGNDVDTGERTDKIAISAWQAPVTDESEPMLSQVMVIGATVDVSRNRIACPVQDSNASLITFAESFSIVSLNQTTRSIYATTLVDSYGDTDALGAPPSGSLCREVGNQVLFEEADHLKATMRDMLNWCSRKLLQLPTALDAEVEF